MSADPNFTLSVRSTEDLKRIDECLKATIWVLFFTLGVYFFAFNRTSSWPVRALVAATAIPQIVVVYRLARALRLSTTLTVGRCLLCLIPTICLICLAAMMSDAKEALSRRI
jgi:hypothetical protein